jgi:hypothetical protein
MERAESSSTSPDNWKLSSMRIVSSCARSTTENTLSLTALAIS